MQLMHAAHGCGAHLAEEMPSIQEAKQQMPVTSEYMISSDASDGYDVCVIEENSRKYVCLGCWSSMKQKYRILECVRMPQGLKSADVWYPCWMHHGFNRCFGTAWRLWPHGRRSE